MTCMGFTSRDTRTFAEFFARGLGRYIRCGKTMNFRWSITEFVVAENFLSQFCHQTAVRVC